MSIFDKILFSVPKKKYELFDESYTFVDNCGMETDYLHFKSKEECKRSEFIIFFHGCGYDLTSIYYQMEKTCKKLNNKGLDVLCIEYPGFGRSSEYMDPSSYQLLVYYPKMLDRLFNLLNKKWEDSILIGHSIGTTISIKCSSYFKIKHIILVSPYISIKNIVYDFIGVFGCFYEDCFENYKIINKIDCPVSLVHGLNDWLICHHHTDYLAKNINNDYLYKMFYIDDMNHNIEWDCIYCIVLPSIFPDFFNL